MPHPDTPVIIKGSLFLPSNSPPEKGNEVACRFTLRGTHRSEFMGVPASGKAIEVSGITILRFAGGRCAERWSNLDHFGLLQQIGAIPTQS